MATNITNQDIDNAVPNKGSSTPDPNSEQPSRKLLNAAIKAINNEVNSFGSSQLLGVGQTYQNLFSLRSAGVTYTNSTSKPILICISVAKGGSGTDVTFYVAVNSSNFDTQVGIGATARPIATVNYIVPPGGTYRLNLSQGSIEAWTELR